nr:TPA: orf y [Tanacetum cinerariifolium]
MSLANIKATTEYQEAIQATEDIESPAVGFAKTTDYKGGLTNQVNAVIKQNNTLLYLASKQSQNLIELEEKFDRLKQKVHTIIEKEIQPADLEDSISSLAKRLDNFSISESYESLRNSRLQHIHLGIFMIRLHTLHRRSTGTNALVVLRDTRWEDNRQIIVTMEVDLSAGTQWQGGKSNLLITIALTGRLSNTSYMGFQYSVKNVVDHLTTNGITAILGERRSIDEIEGMSWNLKPPEQTSVRVPSRVAVNERLNRSDCLNEARILKDEPLNKVRRSNKPRRSKRRIGEKWSTLREPSGKWDYYVRYDAPINTTPIEEIAATGWGEEFLDDEVTPGKVTILNGSEEESDWDNDERSGGKNLVIQEKLAQNQQDFLDEYLPQWDDHLTTQKQESELEWENPFAVKRDYQFGYPQGKSKLFSGGYGEYHNSQWTLPSAWTESGVMLVLPADPGL